MEAAGGSRRQSIGGGLTGSFYGRKQALLAVLIALQVVHLVLVLVEAHQAGRGGKFLWLDGKLPFTLFTLASFVSTESLSCQPYTYWGGAG